MNQRGLVHARMMTTLQAGFFPDLCDIEAPSAPDANPDDYGQPQTTWSALTDHEDLPCRVAPAATASSQPEEIRRPDMTLAIVTDEIMLAGYYPSISVSQRVVVTRASGETATYDILAVDHDGQETMTRLRCEVVTT